MKKLFGIIFWVGVIGGLVYVYKKNPHMKEYCEIIKKRMVELFEHIQSCHHQKVEEETEE